MRIASRGVMPLLALALCWASAMQAADTKLELGVPNPTINTAYFIPDFVGVLAVQPRNLLAQPVLAKSPLGEMLGSLQNDVGFDMRKLDEAIFAMGPRVGPRPEDAPTGEVVGIILRNSEPFVRDKFPKNLRDAVEATHEGHKYYASPNPWQPSFALPNDKTLIIASEGDLKRMLTAKATKSPLIDAMAKADRRKGANLVVAVDPIRKMAAADGANQQQLPPPIDTFLKIAELVDTVDVSVGASDLALDGFLRTKNVDSADQLLGFTNSLLGLATVGLDQLGEQVKQAPPNQRREIEAGVKLAKEVLGLIKPKVEGTNVAIHIEGKSTQDAVSAAIALAVPQIEKARASAERYKATNNLRQIVLSMHNYESAHNKLPSNKLDKNGKPLLSWRVAILPYVEQQALHDQFKLDEPWDSPANKKLLEKMPDVFKSAGSKAPVGKTTYLGVKGKGTIFGADKPLGFADLTDGTSNTILVVDAADDRAVEWTKPDDLAFDPEKPLAGLVGHLPDRFLAAFADGSVRFLPAKIDPEMLRRVMTHSDGKVIELPDENDFEGEEGAAKTTTSNKVDRAVVPEPPPIKTTVEKKK